MSDLDSLRVSSSQLSETQAVQDSSAATQMRIAEQVASRVGKQLVPLVPPRQSATSRPVAAAAAKPGQKVAKTAKESAEDAASARRTKKCAGLTLKEFQGVSLDPSEVIVRDAEGQPIYLLTLRAFLRQSDGLFLPLIAFRDNREHVIRSSLSPAFSSLPFSKPPLNCTFSYSTSETGGASGVPLSHLEDRPFAEEVHVFFECGSLVLQINGDGNHLELESLALYRPSEQPGQTGKLADPPRAPALFASEFAPLLVFPRQTRYRCQNRVALAGLNASSLVIDEMEFLRLPIPTVYGSAPRLVRPARIQQDQSSPAKPAGGAALPDAKSSSSRVKRVLGPPRRTKRSAKVRSLGELATS